MGRIDGIGGITEFPVPNVSRNLNGLVLGPEGDLWFGEENSDPGFRIDITVGRGPLVPSSVRAA